MEIIDFFDHAKTTETSFFARGSKSTYNTVPNRWNSSEKHKATVHSTFCIHNGYLCVGYRRVKGRPKAVSIHKKNYHHFAGKLFYLNGMVAMFDRDVVQPGNTVYTLIKGQYI